MENLEIIFESLRKVAWSFLWTGILAIICGVLIFMYPNLLSMLVGLFLIVTGLTSIIAAKKVKKLSKISLKL